MGSSGEFHTEGQRFLFVPLEKKEVKSETLWMLLCSFLLAACRKSDSFQRSVLNRIPPPPHHLRLHLTEAHLQPGLQSATAGPILIPCDFLQAAARNATQPSDCKSADGVRRWWWWWGAWGCGRWEEVMGVLNLQHLSLAVPLMVILNGGSLLFAWLHQLLLTHPPSQSLR